MLVDWATYEMVGIGAASTSHGIKPRRRFTSPSSSGKDAWDRGEFLVILVLAFCVQVFMAIDHRSHSVSDTLYGIFPYIVPSFLVLLWIASKTSVKE